MINLDDKGEARVDESDIMLLDLAEVSNWCAANQVGWTHDFVGSCYYFRRVSDELWRSGEFDTTTGRHWPFYWLATSN